MTFDGKDVKVMAASETNVNYFTVEKSKLSHKDNKDSSRDHVKTSHV